MQAWREAPNGAEQLSNQMAFECFIALVSWSNLRGINPSRLLHQGELKALTTEHSESILLFDHIDP